MSARRLKTWVVVWAEQLGAVPLGQVDSSYSTREEALAFIKEMREEFGEQSRVWIAPVDVELEEVKR